MHSEVSLAGETLIVNNIAEQSGGGLYFIYSLLLPAFKHRFIQNTVSSNTGKGGAIFILDNNCNTMS